jgi:hypothetical protein
VFVLILTISVAATGRMRGTMVVVPREALWAVVKKWLRKET